MSTVDKPNWFMTMVKADTSTDLGTTLAMIDSLKELYEALTQQELDNLEVRGALQGLLRDRNFQQVLITAGANISVASAAPVAAAIVATTTT